MLKDAVRSAVKVLISTPSALITDIDGTISPIVDRPEQAVVSAQARASLAELKDQLALVGVVTAREEAVARRMVGVEGLSYIGNYALDGANTAVTSGDVEGAKARLLPMLETMPCVELEDKGTTFALHYRNCDDKSVRLRLLELAEPICRDSALKVLEGKQVIELAPRDLPDKGTAVMHLTERGRISGLVYLGDDISDIAVFQEIRRRRDEEGLPGLAVAVIDAETDDAVRATADVELEGVKEVEAFLDSLCRELAKGGAA
jgi:trehalose 6-phosphate phosphatase